ncbi:MAG: ACT domain-containing protein [Anaerolineales bacterium]
MEKIPIGGVLLHENLATISVQGTQAAASVVNLLTAFKNEGINIQFITHQINQNGLENIVLAVDETDIRKSLFEICQLQRQNVIDQFSIQRECATVGIYGPDFRLRPGIAGSYLHALHQFGVLVKSISTSISTCTVLISAREIAQALQAIRSAFDDA